MTEYADRATTFLGASHYRARYYDPTIGRFVSMDPIGFKGGNNHYAFVKNNPVLLRDPKGTCPPTDPPCKVTIFRPGMNGLTFYNGCGDEGMKLIWAADCKGDRKCCLNTLNDKQNYQDPCEKYGGKYFIWDKAQLVIGWCCKKN
jgi:RHS repeat-associated protein